jgi:hypothetical protein
MNKKCVTSKINNPYFVFTLFVLCCVVLCRAVARMKRHKHEVSLVAKPAGNIQLEYRKWGRKTKLSLNEVIWIVKVGGYNWLRLCPIEGFMRLNLSVLW